MPAAERTPYTRDYGGYRPKPIVRLFRNHAGTLYQGRVHEIIGWSVAPQRFGQVDIPIYRHMDEDLNKMRVDRQPNYLRGQAAR